MSEPEAYDFFAGSAPPGLVFAASAAEIREVYKDVIQVLDTVARLCLIGLVSHTEAFFRDGFACLINIAPRLLRRLQSSGLDVTIDSVAAIESSERLPYRIGFLVAEKMDFGTAKKVNALYSALLGITPFSSDDQRTYEGLLADRNLAVHYGGALTHSYLRQRFGAGYTGIAFNERISVHKDYLDRELTFLFNVVGKTVTAAHGLLSRMVADHELELTPSGTFALQLYELWDSTWADFAES